MSRRATGVSKRQNRIQLAGLNLFYEWRNTGLVENFNEPVPAELAAELTANKITADIPAIELCVKIIELRGEVK
jgi:hypothetical protein